MGGAFETNWRKRDMYGTLVSKPKGRDHLEALSVDRGYN